MVEVSGSILSIRLLLEHDHRFQQYGMKAGDPSLIAARTTRAVVLT